MWAIAKRLYRKQIEKLKVGNVPFNNLGQVEMAIDNIPNYNVINIYKPIETLRNAKPIKLLPHERGQLQENYEE